MRFALGLIIVFSFAPSFADERFSASELTLAPGTGGFAQRTGHHDELYSLPGTGQIRSLRSDDFDQLVARWLTAHPNAVATEVCSMLASARREEYLIFVWIADGDENLNVYLVGEGAVFAGTMHDALEFVESLPPEITKLIDEVPGGPSTPPRRLVSHREYYTFTDRVEQAGQRAAIAKKGIWSSRYDGLRDDDEMQQHADTPGLSPRRARRSGRLTQLLTRRRPHGIVNRSI